MHLYCVFVTTRLRITTNQVVIILGPDESRTLIANEIVDSVGAQSMRKNVCENN